MAGDFELPPADILALTLSEAVADEHGERAQEYLAGFVEELLDLEPGVKDHFVGTVLAELVEEIAEREDARYAHSTVELIKAIQESWGQED